MKWIPRELIFSPTLNSNWMCSHAQMPIALRVDNNILRIFFSTRDIKGRSNATFIDVEESNPANIIYVHDRFLLEYGKFGTFDDSGIMFSSFVFYNDIIYMYYIGWNQGVTVPYHLSIGLALSNDFGFTFYKYSEAPILGRNCYDKISVTTPFVIKDTTGWRMWYSSFDSWSLYEDRLEPTYLIKYAYSTDGVIWNTNDQYIIPQRISAESQVRPFVHYDKNFFMYFSYRGIRNYRSKFGERYQIDCAESEDSFNWTRSNSEKILYCNNNDWDSDMFEYPFIYKSIQGDYYLFYNGNDFGKNGFGYAINIKDKI